MPHELAMAASMDAEDAIALLQLLAKDHVVSLQFLVYHRDCPSDVPRAPIYVQAFTDGWPLFPLQCDECDEPIQADEAEIQLSARIEGRLPRFNVAAK